MMEVTFFFRKPTVQVSIETVFARLFPEMQRHIGVKQVSVKHNRVRPSHIVRNLIYCRRHRGELNHITGDIQYCALALPAKTTVMTVHDTVGLDRKDGSRVGRWLVYWLWYYLPLRRLRHVVCITEETRRRLAIHFPWAAPKLMVIHDPADPAFVYCPKAFAAVPTVLHVGTRSNKNLERVAQALQGVACRLRIIGQLSDGQRQTLRACGISYTNAAGISDEQLREEYRQCDIVSFPSLYEGFGLPVIEGFATGRVVVTSQREPMISVAGGAAIMVDPEDVASMRAGFLTAIHNETLRNEKIAQGLQVVKRYAAEQIAREYVKLYQQIANEP